MAEEAHTADLLGVNAELARNPQPTYQNLLEGSPVLRVDGVGVIASSRAAIDEILHDPATFSSSMSATDLKTRRPLIPLQTDPPAQRTYRKILDRLFAPQKMKLLEEPVAALVNELIDTFVDEAEVDFAKQFSVPFPSQVFITMFGLPLDELPILLAMKDGIIRPQHVVGQPLGHPDTDAHQQATADSIYAYFEKLLTERAGVRGDDLISQLLDAEVDGDRLSQDEIVDICFQLVIAGLDTVSASLDCFFGYLAQHPEQRRRLVAHPEAIAQVVEELLRWETPVMAVARIATRDSEIAGCPVHAGDQVIALIGAANVDEKEFADADVRFDRDVNRHLAFGGGIHRCLGSHLARLELRVALREWHRRIPEYRLKPGVELDFTPGIRSVDSFPILLG
ncbi:MAG TPA: cytochrome P450 [Acidimicrobiales bacterium]|nr:cytochrome P450 [Acidimicrobiales bacterium]